MPGARAMRAITSAESAICGTHFGLTKAPASITVSPVVDSRSISPTLASSGTTAFSFCSPSRGPTSTMRTRAGSMSGRLEADQGDALIQLVANGKGQAGDGAVPRRGHGVLHLHRLQYDQRLALGHLGA